MFNILLILFGTLGCASSENDFYFDQPDTPDDEEQVATHYLVIDFQDGFKEDDVEIRVDGVLVSEMENVTTSLLTGLATSVETAASAGKITLTINVLTRDASSSLEIDLSSDMYIGVSMTPEGVEFFVSDSPFGYG